MSRGWVVALGLLGLACAGGGASAEQVTGLCCLAVAIPLALPLWMRLERDLPGAGLALLTALVLLWPLSMWDSVHPGEGPARLGAWILLSTDRVSHDLLAALLPRAPLSLRAGLGALWVGGSVGAALALGHALIVRGRRGLAVLVAPPLVFFFWALQRGPDPEDFAPHDATRWPAFEAPARPRPLPVRQRLTGAREDGLLRGPPVERLVRRRALQRGPGCVVEVARDFNLQVEDVDAGRYAALVGEAAPADPLARVEGLRWVEAVGVANLLSEALGLEPAYHIRPGVVRWAPDSRGVRLPTLAELSLVEAIEPERAPRGAVWAWDARVEGAARCGPDPGIGADAAGFAQPALDLDRAVHQPGAAPRFAPGDAPPPGVGLRLVRSVSPRSAGPAASPAPSR